MSYDKYIKYKNKYLQLKAKYTQVGGNLRWVIDDLEQHGPPATTPITQEESIAINKKIPSSGDRSIEIKAGTLKDTNDNKISVYGYTIYSSGAEGTRNSLRGTYSMKLKDISIVPASITQPPRSAYPPPPSSAHLLSTPPHPSYVPPSTPPPHHPPSTSTSVSGASAFRVPPPSSKPHPGDKLPLFMSIGTIYDEYGNKSHSTLVVQIIGLGFLGINQTIKKDDAIFNRINEKQINMTFRGNTYPLGSTADADTWTYHFDYLIP
jgi:hypothetical protein